MLHRYEFSNFQSFRDRVEVDLTLTKKTTLTDWMANVSTGERISKVMAVIGPNGGGKTTLIKPVAFVGWFISQSFQQLAHDAPIPVTPHALAGDQPSEFACEISFDGKIWRYVLKCTQARVIHEALYQKRERFGYVFIRDWDAETETYSVKQQDFGLAPQIAKKIRQNASMISEAAQYGVPLAVRMVSSYIVSNVDLSGRMPMDSSQLFPAAEHYAKNPSQEQLMAQLLSRWDFGLTGVSISEIQTPTPEGQTVSIWVPFGSHGSEQSAFTLPFMLESSGTQSAFILLSRLLHALEIGGLAVIDEFENDLHPHMLEPILELFANKTTNSRNAQLLFTCHAVEVLNLLHKSQVMLVQKNQHCESEACRLDQISGIRSDDNLYGKYMAGAYGAVPEL